MCSELHAVGAPDTLEGGCRGSGHFPGVQKAEFGARCGHTNAQTHTHSLSSTSPTLGGAVGRLCAVRPPDLRAASHLGSPAHSSGQGPAINRQTGDAVLHKVQKHINCISAVYIQPPLPRSLGGELLGGDWGRKENAWAE